LFAQATGRSITPNSFWLQNPIRISPKPQLMLLGLFIGGDHGFLSCRLCGRYFLGRWPFRAGLAVGVQWEKLLPIEPDYGEQTVNF
jgi:hypothetical protein